MKNIFDAVRKGDVHLVKEILFGKPTAVYLKDDDGKTPADIAKELGNWKLHGLLKEVENRIAEQQGKLKLAKKQDFKFEFEPVVKHGFLEKLQNILFNLSMLTLIMGFVYVYNYGFNLPGIPAIPTPPPPPTVAPLDVALASISTEMARPSPPEEIKPSISVPSMLSSMTAHPGPEVVTAPQPILDVSFFQVRATTTVWFQQNMTYVQNPPGAYVAILGKFFWEIMATDNLLSYLGR